MVDLNRSTGSTGSNQSSKPERPSPPGRGSSLRSRGRRQAVRVSSDQLVEETRLDGTPVAFPVDPGQRPFPLVLRPSAAAGGGFDPVAWAADHRDLLERRLAECGALLLRGFAVDSVDRFEALVAAGAGDPLRYTERSSPRSQVAGNIYTSTDYPPEREIFLHNEQSYNLTFPRKIAFCCLEEPETGGATPIADSRRVLRRLPADLVRRFAEAGYLYRRNFGSGAGLPWQTAFQTESREAVEAYGREQEIAMEWLGEGRLRTRQRRPAVARHPVSGELTWFNHATFFHVSTLEEDVRQGILATFSDEELPNQTAWGDGEPFEPEVMATLQGAYRAETVRFPWQEGDVLLLDNMLAAHGREPFTGRRKVVVSMAGPVSWSEVEASPEQVAAALEGDTAAATEPTEPAAAEPTAAGGDR